jgi:hypothetical protein
LAARCCRHRRCRSPRSHLHQHRHSRRVSRPGRCPRNPHPSYHRLDQPRLVRPFHRHRPFHPPDPLHRNHRSLLEARDAARTAEARDVAGLVDKGVKGLLQTNSGVTITAASGAQVTVTKTLVDCSRTATSPRTSTISTSTRRSSEEARRPSIHMCPRLPTAK